MFQNFQRLVTGVFTSGSVASPDANAWEKEAAIECAIEIQFRSHVTIEAELDQLLQIRNHLLEHGLAQQQEELRFLDSVCRRFVGGYGRNWAPDEQQLQEVRAHVRSRLNDRRPQGEGLSSPGSHLAVVEGCAVGHPAGLLEIILRAAKLYVGADDEEGAKWALMALQVAVRSRHNVYVLQQSFGLFPFLTEALSRAWDSHTARQGMSREEEVVPRRPRTNPAITAAALELVNVLLSVLSSERYPTRNRVILPETTSVSFAEQMRASKQADGEMLIRLQHLLRGPVSEVLRQTGDNGVEKEVQLQCLSVLCLLWPGPNKLSPSRSFAHLKQACGSESDSEGALSDDASSVAALMASFIRGPSSRQKSDTLLLGLDDDDLCSGSERQGTDFQVQAWALEAMAGLPDTGLPEDFRGRIAKLLSWAIDLQSSSGAEPDKHDAQGTMVHAVIRAMQGWATHTPHDPFGGPQVVPGASWDLSRLEIILNACRNVIESYEGEGDGIVLTCHAVLTLVMAALGSTFLAHGPASKDGISPGVRLVQLLRGEENTNLKGKSLWTACLRKVQRNGGVLRHMVLALEAAASVPALENCSPEMGLLISLLERPNPVVADAACSALSRLLRRAPRTASAAAVRVGLCGALCALLHVIQGVIQDNGVEAHLTIRIEDGADSSGVCSRVELDLGLSKVLRTQANALGTLRTLFEVSQTAQLAPLGDADTISILCSLMESGNSAARSATADLLFCLLTVPRSGTEDDEGRKVLCTKLLELLSLSLRATPDGYCSSYSAGLGLLGVLKRALRAEPEMLQAILIESGAFQRLVQILQQSSGALLTMHRIRLCQEVLQVLTSLLHGSQELHRAFEHDVGWDVLQSGLESVLRRSSVPESVLGSLLLLATQSDSLENTIAGGELNCEPTSRRKDDDTNTQTTTRHRGAVSPEPLQSEAAPDIVLTGPLGIYLTLLPRSDPSTALSAHCGLPMICHLVQHSIRNRDVCSSAGVVSIMLHWARQAPPQSVCEWIVETLRVLACHSLPLEALEQLLRLVKHGGSKKLSEQLLAILADAAWAGAPADYLHYSNGGLLLPEISIPLGAFQSGISFAGWIPWRQSSDLSRGGQRTEFPVLLSVKTAEGGGFALMLSPTTARSCARLVVHFWGSQSITSAFQEADTSDRAQFPVGQWRHIVLTLVPGGSFFPMTVTLWLDGKRMEPVSSSSLNLQSRPALLRYPLLSKEPIQVMVCGVLESKDPSSSQRGLFGASAKTQAADGLVKGYPVAYEGPASAIYLFDGPVGAEVVDCLWALGPGYTGSLMPYETGSWLDRAPDRIVRLLSSRAPEQWPGLAWSSVVREDVEEGIKINCIRSCRRVMLDAVIGCVGGIAALLPLLGEEFGLSGDGVASIIRAIGGLLANDVLSCRAWHEQGCKALAWLLRASPGGCLSPSVVDAIFDWLAPGSVCVMEGGRPQSPEKQTGSQEESMSSDIIRTLCCDLSIWQDAPTETLSHLCRRLEELFVVQGDAWRFLSVPAILLSGRENVQTPGLEPGKRRARLRLAVAYVESVHGREGVDEQSPRGANENRSKKNHASLEDDLLVFLGSCLSEGESMNDPRPTEHVMDVGSALLRLLRGQSLVHGAAVSALGRLGAPSVFVPLIGHANQEVRLLGLRLVGATIMDARGLAQRDAVAAMHDVLLSRPKISSSSQGLISAAERVCLFEMVCGGTPWPQIASASLAPPLVSAPQIVVLLLQVDGGASTLSTLRSLLRGGLHSGSCDRLLTQPQVLAELLDISAEYGTGQKNRTGSPEEPPAPGLAWEILILLLAHAISSATDGTRRFVAPLIAEMAHQNEENDRHALGHRLVLLWVSLLRALSHAQHADQREERGMEASSEEESWTVVSVWLAEPYLSNICQLCKILAEQLLVTLPALFMSDEDGSRCTKTSAGQEVKEWIGGENSTSPGQTEATVPDSAWRLMGLALAQWSGTVNLTMPPVPDTVELEEAAWYLLHSLVGSGPARAALAGAEMPQRHVITLLHAVTLLGLQRGYSPRTISRTVKHLRAVTAQLVQGLMDKGRERSDKTEVAWLLPRSQLLLACGMKLERQRDILTTEQVPAIQHANTLLAGLIGAAMVHLGGEEEGLKNNSSQRPDQVLDVQLVLREAGSLCESLLGVEAWQSSESRRWRDELRGMNAMASAGAAASKDAASDSKDFAASFLGKLRKEERAVGLRRRQRQQHSWWQVKRQLEYCQLEYPSPGDQYALWQLSPEEDVCRRRRFLEPLLETPVYAKARESITTDAEPRSVSPSPPASRMTYGASSTRTKAWTGFESDEDNEQNERGKNEESFSGSRESPLQGNLKNRGDAGSSVSPQPTTVSSPASVATSLRTAAAAAVMNVLPEYVRKAVPGPIRWMLEAASSSLATVSGDGTGNSVGHRWPVLWLCQGHSRAGHVFIESLGTLCFKALASDGSTACMDSREWGLQHLTCVSHAKFLLQPTAVELFWARSEHGGPTFLSFTSGSARDAFCRALAVSCPDTTEIMDERRKKAKALEFQQAWLRWEMSNFEYLMALNSLAGRTYNDLNQYPVFPWILTDYSSATIDLSDPAVYRDLSKPIGALNEKRLAALKERSQSLMQDPDMPPFLYGSHYSSAGTVLFFLLRLEPYTRHAWDLQDGRFDHADRLFHSVAEAWNNCLESTSDVKELTPEFYYLPDFLVNGNSYQLGVRQDGTTLGDVQLPPWSKNCPDIFIRTLRDALESEHVSLHLHDWIDLIFGARQRGAAAEAVGNTFFYTTYEGTVDLDAIQDKSIRQGLADQIRHFGQTPSQLFTSRKPHPARRLPCPTPSLLQRGQSFVDARDLCCGAILASGSGNVEIAALGLSADGAVVAVQRDGRVGRYRWFATRAEAGSFSFGGTESLENGGAWLEELVLPSSEPGQLPGISEPGALVGSNNAVLVRTPDNNGVYLIYATGGGRRLTCVPVNGKKAPLALKPTAAAEYHKAPITCVAAQALEERETTSHYWVATGDRDGTVLVWELNAIKGGKQSSSSSSGNGGGAVAMSSFPFFRNDTRSNSERPSVTLSHPIQRPSMALHGHSGPILCLGLNAALGIVVSASRGKGTPYLDGSSVLKGSFKLLSSSDEQEQGQTNTKTCSSSSTVLIHSLVDGRCIRSLRCPTHAGSASLLAIAAESGLVLMHTHADLAVHALHINGRLVASAEPFERLSDLRVGPAGDVVFSVGTSGMLTVRSLPDLHTVIKVPVANMGPLQRLTITPEGAIITAAKCGSLAILTKGA